MEAAFELSPDDLQGTKDLSIPLHLFLQIQKLVYLVQTLHQNFYSNKKQE